MIKPELFPQLILEGVIINFYCDEQGITGSDREALKLLNSQLRQNPDKSLDELFVIDSSIPEGGQKLLAAVEELLRSMPGQGAMVDASHKMCNDAKYRQRIYATYQTQIVPLLHPEEQIQTHV